MNPKKAFEEKLNGKLDPLEVLREINYRIDTITTHTHTLRCFCPIHKETVFRTLTVNTQKKCFKCGFNSCEGFVESDLIDLYAKSKNISRDESILFWAEKIGLSAEIPPDEEVKPTPEKSKIPQEDNPKKPSTVNKDISQEINTAPTAKGTGKSKASKISEEEQQNKIIQFINEKKMNEAVAQLNQLLLINSKNLWGKEALGRILLEKGDLTKAGPLLEEVAYFAIENTDFTKAVEIFQTLIEKKPDNIKWRNPLINLYLQLNRQEDALTDMNQLADLLLKQKKYQDLLEIYDKINTLKPDNVETKKSLIKLCHQVNQTNKALIYTLELVDIYLKYEQIEEALKLLTETIKAAPGNTDLRRKLIDILVSQGKSSQAVKELEALALEYTKLKDSASAAQIYKEIFKHDTHNIKALRTLAEIYEKTESTSELAEIHFQMASVLLTDQKIQPAIDILEKLHQNQPAHEEILRTLIGCYLQIKQSEKAIDCLLKLADQYREKKDLENSLKCSMDVLEINPDSIPAHERLVDIYHKAKKLDQAVFHLNRIAEIYLKNETLDQAKKAIRIALKFPVRKLSSLNLLADIYRKENSKPKLLVILRILAQEYIRQQKKEEAKSTLEEANGIQPDCPSIIALQGSLHLLENQPDEYIAAIRKACALYGKAGNHRKNIKLLQEAWVMNPDDDTLFNDLISSMIQSGEQLKASEFLLRRARDHIKQTKFQDARQELVKIIQIEPNHQEALNLIANICLQSGEITEAANYYLKLANLYLESNKFKEAGTIGQKLIKSDPRLVEGHQILATVYRHLEKPDKALKHLMFIGKLLFEKDHIDETISYYKHCKEEYPEQLEFYQVLIELYKTQNQISEALSVSQQLSSCLITLNKTEELTLLYQSMVLLDPENLDTRLLLAEHYIKTGSIHEALMEYDVISGKYLILKDYKKVKQIYLKMKELSPEMEEINEAFHQLEKLTAKS